MAKVTGGIAQGLSGKTGGVVFVQRDGQTYIRVVPVRSKSSWTPRQQLHRTRFKAVNNYCAIYKRTLIPQIWNLAAEHNYGYNLFLKTNMPAFALDGQLADVEKLHFSAGKLPLPQHFKAKRADNDPLRVEVSWVNDHNMKSTRDSDQLLMIVGYMGHSTPPIATGVKRSACQAIIELPSDQLNMTGIYLFFTSSTRDSYSPDQYFGV